MVRTGLADQQPDAGHFEQGNADAGKEIQGMNGAAAGNGGNHQTALAKEHHQRGLLLQHEVGNGTMEKSYCQPDYQARDLHPCVHGFSKVYCLRLSISIRENAEKPRSQGEPEAGLEGSFWRLLCWKAGLKPLPGTC